MQNRRFAQSPTDARINIKVGGRLRCQIPVWLNAHPLISLRIAAIPQRWPTCRGNMRRFSINPDVIKDLTDLRALGNEYDQAHLPTAQRSQAKGERAQYLSSRSSAARSCASIHTPASTENPLCG